MSSSKRFTCDGVYPDLCMYLVQELTLAQITEALEKGGRRDASDALISTMRDRLTKPGDWEEKGRVYHVLRNVWINKGFIRLAIEPDPKSEFAVYHHDGWFHLAIIRKENVR